MSLTSLFTDIANAIRTKTGSQATIVANNFPTAIASIPGANPKANLGTKDSLTLDKTSSQALITAGVGYFFDPITFSSGQLPSSAYNSETGLVEIDEIRFVDQGVGSSMFWGCSNLKTAPTFKTSDGSNNYSGFTHVDGMFYNCQTLQNVPVYDLSNVTNMSNMFMDCYTLTDESLNNILAMCITATGVQNKDLSDILDVSGYGVSNLQALPNWQAFTNAGWTASGS